MPDLAQWLPLLALPFDAEVADTPRSTRSSRLPARPPARRPRSVPVPHAADADDCSWSRTRTGWTTRRSSCSAKLAQPGPRPWLVVTTRRPRGPPLGATAATLFNSTRSRGRRAGSGARRGRRHALSEDQLAAVTDRAAGNPLFIRELGAGADRRRRPARDGGVAADDPHRHARAERPAAASARVGDRPDVRPRSARRDPAGGVDRSRAVGSGSPISSSGRGLRTFGSVTTWCAPRRTRALLRAPP